MGCLRSQLGQSHLWPWRWTRHVPGSPQGEVSEPVPGFSRETVKQIREAPTCCYLGGSRKVWEWLFMLKSWVKDSPVKNQKHSFLSKLWPFRFEVPVGEACVLFVFLGGTAWVGVGVRARKLVSKEEKKKILYQKSGVAEGWQYGGYIYQTLPRFYLSYTSAPGDKRKHSLRSFYEACITLILKPKKDMARKKNDRAIWSTSAETKISAHRI